MKLKHSLIILAALASTTGAFAQVVDGTAEAGYYGSALWTNNLGSGFGNSNLGSINNANGSEIDQVFGKTTNTSLSLVVAGNLETNYNKLVLFVDTGASNGVNTIGAANVSSDDFGYMNSLAGTKFDTGFKASYAIWVRTGTPGTQSMYVTVAKLGDNTVSGAGDLITANNTNPGTSFWTVAAPGANFALNEINVAGVDGNPAGTSSGAGVNTGFEASINWSALGISAPGVVKVAGFVGSSGTYLSNQVIGGLPAASGNLGNAPVDFSTIAGNQYVTLQNSAVPEPISLSVLTLGFVAMLRKRKNS